uniref:Uncharacterized protein n=1 Tax=Anguilla anguilla TaxID=7936 RepID=A0A0E9SC05_ANGAN
MSIMKRTKQEGGRDAVKVKVEYGKNISISVHIRTE